MRVICFKYCKMCMRSLIKKILTFCRIYGHVRFNLSTSAIGFEYMQRYCYAFAFFIRFSLNLPLKLSFLTKPIFPKFCVSFNHFNFPDSRY